MSDSDQTESKLDQILGHLVKQGAALGTISKRLDTIEAQIKLANQQNQRLSKRQADLEEHFANQAGDCSGVMTRLADRINSLEAMLTPIPTSFDDSDPDKNGGAP
jgi:chromosome segregation ATPase